MNWINGKTHLGNSKAPVPAIFGMNFQAVSVGQKLIENGVKGGYTDAAGDPTPELASEITFVDACDRSDGACSQEPDLLQIDHHHHHRQARTIPDRSQSLLPDSRPLRNQRYVAGQSPRGGGSDPGQCKLRVLGPTEDDISQLWLSPGNTTATNTMAAVNFLESNAKAAGIGEIFYLASLETMFNAPGVPTVNGPCCALLPGGDPRTPDIIVAPNIGVIYTGSANKQEEHGGFAFDDTNVMLLVSNPSLQPRTVTSWVETMQVAPTILQLLGLDPNSLDAVQMEGTPVLPALFNQSQPGVTRPPR